eukprot:TRINITY_DN31015_c0_g1_i1.p1 TRINITY_DN31015_c0_g1~~TRINITY_DN31015_c0_g1_i1.p1  ORF type:complete len:403 (-),score=41.78 TRINITY_DN31015_c0_g1_i1:126-1334(-)
MPASATHSASDAGRSQPQPYLTDADATAAAASGDFAVGAGAPTFAEGDATLLLGAGGIDYAASDFDDSVEDIRAALDRLEALQFESRSPQQPTPELERAIIQVFDNRPEWRMRMAVMTKSPWLRKKILAHLPKGGRAVGCATLGNSHPWRNPKLRAEYTDHNWPKVSLNAKGDYHLPGGTAQHHRLLRAPVDKIRYDPLVSHTPNYTIPKTKRFPGTLENGELNKAQVQKKGTPGPGAYFKSVPRGTAFATDCGETIVFGANHICPWKGALGHQINPVHSDQSVLHATPKWSFPKTRRTVSEVMSGHNVQDGGPVKTDRGCLSPGPVYEHYSSFRANTTRALSLKPRRSRSTPAIHKVRCVPVDPLEGDYPDRETSSCLTEGTETLAQREAIAAAAAGMMPR